MIAMGDPADRPTLSEMAATPTQQWSCPRCGMTTWWVRNSYFVASDNSRHRRRECRNCHQTLYTREVLAERPEDGQA